jgi:hypothetical protein
VTVFAAPTGALADEVAQRGFAPSRHLFFVRITRSLRALERTAS